MQALTPAENFVVLMALIKYSQTLIDAEMAKAPEARNLELIRVETLKMKMNAEAVVPVSNTL